MLNSSHGMIKHLRWETDLPNKVFIVSVAIGIRSVEERHPLMEGISDDGSTFFVGQRIVEYP